MAPVDASSQVKLVKQKRSEAKAKAAGKAVAKSNAKATAKAKAKGLWAVKKNSRKNSSGSNPMVSVTMKLDGGKYRQLCQVRSKYLEQARKWCQELNDGASEQDILDRSKELKASAEY